MGRGRRPDPGRAWGGSPHARRYRGSLDPWPPSLVQSYPAGTAPAKLSRSLLKTRSPVPAWSVMPYPHPPRQRSCHGGCYPGPAPLHAVRVRQGSCRRRRHAPCLAAPGVPLRCVVGGATAPGRDRPSAAVVPRATVIPPRCDAGTVRCLLADSRHTLRQHLRSPQSLGACHAACLSSKTRTARGPPSPPLPDSAPGWTPGLAMCGAGPRRLCSARWPRACASASGWAAVGGRPR